MKIRNKRPYAVEVDHDGKTYECAARPGVVEVPDELGKSLLQQEDAWSSAEDGDGDDMTAKRPARAAADKEG